MLGTFQRSHQHIALDASAEQLTQVLLGTVHIRRWLWPQHIVNSLPAELHAGLMFTSRLGAITINHEVQVAETGLLRLVLSGAIDGFHEWRWGAGWLEVRLEGVSLLPLDLGQTATLLRLRPYIAWYQHQSR